MTTQPSANRQLPGLANTPSDNRADNQTWNTRISTAIESDDPLVANFRITRCHYQLSEAMRRAIGENAGANFHSWAVWGSRKAGVTIRQEDKDQASRDATIVAGIVGFLVGVAVGYFTAGILTGFGNVVLWATIGVVTGGYTGYLLAQYTRRSASRLVLQGNRIVLDDIGRATGAYLHYLSESSETETKNEPASGIEGFISTLRPGPTDQGGQDLLRRAFRYYERARLAGTDQEKHEFAYAANCFAILHEHIRLQPLIARSLPFLIKKCVTERLMTFSVGQETLSIHEDVPPIDADDFPSSLQKLNDPELLTFLNGADGWDVNRDSLKNTKASDWTNIKQRMGYIVNLFRSRHLDQQVVASPYSAEQFAAIDSGRLPSRPW